MKSLKSRLIPFAFIASLTVQADACGDKEFGLNEQEFLCDEANARITECCGRAPGLYCTRENGCTHKGPDLGPDVALCVRERSCEAIEAAGLCRINNWQIYEVSNLDGSAGPVGPLGSAAYNALKALSCY